MKIILLLPRFLLLAFLFFMGPLFFVITAIAGMSGGMRQPEVWPLLFIASLISVTFYAAKKGGTLKPTERVLDIGNNIRSKVENPIKEWAEKTTNEVKDASAKVAAARAVANTEGRKSMGVIHTMKGVQDQLEVFEDKVTITPKGVLGFMNKGLKGTKTIPFSSITAIQFKEAGTVFSGYLQFTIPGGNESKGGVFSAARDENTFMYKETKNNALAITIKEYIEARVKEFRAPRATQSQSNTSLSDELIKLASLRDSGILSDQEFQSAKNRLIAG